MDNGVEAQSSKLKAQSSKLKAQSYKIETLYDRKEK